MKKRGFLSSLFVLPQMPVIAGALLAMLGLLGPATAQAPSPVDFDAALRGLRFDVAKLDGNLNASGRGNGLPDSDEMALVAAVLNNPQFDLSARGGASYLATRAAYEQALVSANADMRRLLSTYPTAAVVAAGYAMLGDGSFLAYDHMSAAFGAPMTGDYALARAQGRFFGPDGDADGDGVSNKAEYAAHRAEGREGYLRAALDPDVRRSALVGPSASDEPRLTVGIVLYPGFEVLDVFGPLEMWGNETGFQVVLIAQEAGDVRSAQGVLVKADYGFENSPRLDVLMIPGGVGTRTQLENERMLEFIRLQDRTTDYTTSVCTGSALLARAGVLQGHRATSNKAFFSLAVGQDPSVNWVRRARWVEDGKYFTSSGVSAGTDMALALIARIYGDDHARRLAASLEYRWNSSADDDPFAIQ